MSIINEALKKTQDNLDNFKGKTPAVSNGPDPLRSKPEPVSAAGPLTTQPPAASPGIRNSRRWYFVVAAEILALGAAAWILFVFQPKLFGFFSHPVPPKPRAVHARPAAKAAPTVQPLPKAGARTSPDKLILNGIMTDQNKMVALINGEVYETGDYVNGKKINKITLESVELGEGDAMMTLTIQGR